MTGFFLHVISRHFSGSRVTRKDLLHCSDARNQCSQNRLARDDSLTAPDFVSFYGVESVNWESTRGVRSLEWGAGRGGHKVRRAACDIKKGHNSTSITSYICFRSSSASPSPLGSMERKRWECSALPNGWKREEVTRKSGLSAGKSDVYYFRYCCWISQWR